MSKVNVYRPWGNLAKIQDELANIVNRSLYGDDSNVATSQWLPLVDIVENEKAFVLHADLPGVDVKDIQVFMEDGMLTIKGERHSEHQHDEKFYKRIERAHGEFYRRFSLPDTADGEKIAAKSKHGVLEIVIPKKEKDQSRRIPVEG
ncbi:MAG: Hsp20/alpha crystallin family protein [Legionellales bacterium]|nr:Hsp20/alpha crystallin family protein [Legionellales bacterium]